IKLEPSLYSVNHPTSLVFQEYINFIAQKLNLDYIRFPIGYLPNNLAYSAWLPIYPEIAEENGLQYSSPMVFKQSDTIGGKFLRLDDFVEKSYEIYKEQDKRLRHLRQSQALLDTWGD